MANQAQAQGVLTFSDGSTMAVRETPEQVQAQIEAINVRMPYIPVHEPDGEKLMVRVDHIRSYAEYALEKGPRRL
jgi:hypothetical protein